MPTGPHLVTTVEFLELTKMDHTEFFLLYEGNKLPITKKSHNTYIDISDVRAKRYLPDYKEPKELF